MNKNTSLPQGDRMQSTPRTVSWQAIRVFGVMGAVASFFIVLIIIEAVNRHG